MILILITETKSYTTWKTCITTNKSTFSIINMATTKMWMLRKLLGLTIMQLKFRAKLLKSKLQEWSWVLLKRKQERYIIPIIMIQRWFHLQMHTNQQVCKRPLGFMVTTIKFLDSKLLKNKTSKINIIPWKD